MIIIGLTGSIGMGKSTVGEMMATLGIPVHDSDAAVHQEMQPGASGYLEIVAAFPYFSYPDLYQGKNKIIDRKKLGALVFADPEKRKILEDILHPLVQQSQREFVRKEKAMGRSIVALDIPLLFETGADARVDVTLTVSAPAHVQRARVMARPDMSEEKFEGILASQMLDGEKCARSDYVLKTGLSRAATMRDLKAIIKEIRA